MHFHEATDALFAVVCALLEVTYACLHTESYVSAKSKVQ